MIHLINRLPQYDCQVNRCFFLIVHLGAFIMHASSLSILNRCFITDKIITRPSPVLDFTLLI